HRPARGEDHAINGRDPPEPFLHRVGTDQAVVGDRGIRHVTLPSLAPACISRCQAGWSSPLRKKRIVTSSSTPKSTNRHSPALRSASCSVSTPAAPPTAAGRLSIDRKSTRLNSSHEW